ncbi:hypothetical protein M758_7G021000, partial [Ceratodon purpureus]
RGVWAFRVGLSDLGFSFFFCFLFFGVGERDLDSAEGIRGEQGGVYSCVTGWIQSPWQLRKREESAGGRPYSEKETWLPAVATRQTGGS